MLFPNRLQDFSSLTFSDKTIVDSSHITGHYAVYDDINLGPCKVAGITREGAYIANALITSNESESLRSFVGTYKDERDVKHGAEKEIPTITKETAHVTSHSLHSREILEVNPFRVDSYKDDDHQSALSTADFCDVEKGKGFLQPGDVLETSENSA